MRNFILDHSPKFCEACVHVNGTKYKLNKAKAREFNGYVFTVDEPGKEPDSIALSAQDMKALYFLLTIEP